MYPLMKALKRILLALTILLAAGLAAAILLLPRHIEQLVTTSLRERGFTVDALSMGQVTLSGATVGRISLTLPDGSSSLRVNAADIIYSINSIRSGYVEEIVLHEVDLNLTGSGFATQSRWRPGGHRTQSSTSPLVRKLVISSGSIQARVGPMLFSSSIAGTFGWSPDGNIISMLSRGTASIAGTSGNEFCVLDSATVTAEMKLGIDAERRDIRISASAPTVHFLRHSFRDTEIVAEGNPRRLSYRIRSSGETAGFSGIRGEYKAESLNKSLSLHVESLNIPIGDMAFEARETKVTMGYTANDTTQGVVRAEVNGPKIGGCDIPDFTCGLTLSDGAWEGTIQPTSAERPDPGDTVWHVSNRPDLSAFIIASPELRINPDEAPGSCLASATEIELSADARITALIPIGSGAPAPLLRCEIQNGMIGAGGLSMEGVKGSVEVEIRRGIRSPKSQVLEIASLEFGRLYLRDGRVRFILENQDSILLEQMEWNVFGGQVTSMATRVDRSIPITTIDLVCENLDLVDVLNTIFSKNFAGSGSLFGRLPVRVRHSPTPGIAFGDGYLHSKPGKGHLNFGTSPEVGEIIEQGILRNRPRLDLKEVRRQVTRTLEDFEYSSLILEIGQPPGRRPHGTLNIDGRGAHEHGVPIRFDIRFSVEPL